MNVKNGKCIRHLALKSLQASRTRNLIAVAAIALTAVLFTSLFTIALSINEGFQQSNFRQVGGFSHGGFKYLTKEQFEELKDDPLIDQWGVRRFLGMPMDAPFHKSHVEISYSDAAEAHWQYCDPVEGSLPQEGTDQAATDTHVLELLGIEPEIGAKFTISFDVDGNPTTQTFTLSGWWEYDEAIVANHILIPESRVDEILAETGVDLNNPADGMTGAWNMDVMLKSGSRHIEQDLNQILENHGYQNEERGDNYIDIGVNWGYTGARLSDAADPTAIAAIVAVALLIIFTGYLIIYNVFQISVAGDIRFYGLLKTIGTTPRQLRRIIRLQALALSIAGIPIGLVLGWFVGGQLTPVIVERLNGVIALTSQNPLIFIIAALFALFTVLLSCRRPGRMAAKVSPVEAVRYTEAGSKNRAKGRRVRKVSPFTMAWANLGRSKGKTTVTVISLSLAVVLLAVTVNFTGGFDMDKYVSSFTASDFIVADGAKFQTSTAGFNTDMGVPQTAMDQIKAQGGITDSGVVYGQTSQMLEYVEEDYFRQLNQYFYTPQQLDNLIRLTDRNEEGLLAAGIQLSGMSPFALDHLTVLEGDLSALYEPGSRAIAAVYSEDDYGNADMDSHWAGLGDMVTLRYVEELEYYDPDTGEIYGDYEDVPQGANFVTRPVKFRDVEYEVAALVTVPSALSYRYYGSDEFILNDETFVADTGTDSVMYYAFDITDDANAAMEEFLTNYTENVNPALDYESKATYAGEFESMRTMFLLLGGALSFIVGLVGILNFFNAVLTGIIARRREMAVLQSIGMTGKQLRTMLVWEGLLYALGAAVLALALTVALGPVAFRAVEGLFWFFTYRLTLTPFLLVIPLFALLGAGIPVLTVRLAARHTIVERLREE
ncbi:MAG TPA: ABC transporter permease [Candidatus Acetatifactor stercoripullorum]|uniref:ABC transporter permease n=1 Tax=Candidatus Acetatifactor stercoripullorum TaxID=2838414 RepID=A0A9D1R9M4_9FIRM|nr:ABC transporter permease [uncultured Acetatifactor sp.]HIW82526.1 ABC transporter permease [Candidatus Acetatifactor stercoripullorum]